MRRQRGQAMLLAIVGMLVLAVGMYTTYSISRAVYEKIQLQNAADATAYSIATLEARSFNFLAFVNRAQVANYVQMMEAQSLLSQATFLEGITGHATHLAKASNVSGIKELGAALEPIYRNAQIAVEALERWTPRYIELQTTKNHALFAISAAYVLSTAAQVAEGAPAIALLNDPDAEMGELSLALRLLNVGSYAATFDTSSFGVGTAEDRAGARRIMTELANATRIGSWDSKYIVDRTMLKDVEEGLTKLDAKLKENVAGKLIKELVGAVSAALDKQYIGTTKLLSDAKGLPAVEQTEAAAADASFLSLGGALVSKDVSQAFLSLIEEKDFANVRSMADAGKHCRYREPSPFGAGVDPRFRVDCHDDGHAWRNLLGMPGGITPYINFTPRLSGLATETHNFNQPDVWVLLSKAPASMGMRKGQEDRSVTVRQGGDEASFAPQQGSTSIVGERLGAGTHALSRAQVYYHRPGAWQEMPNFFNPFWGARLAPKNVVIKRLFQGVDMPGDWGELVADNLWMH